MVASCWLSERGVMASVCVIWCLTRDRGSLSPLCALTDHITISESYSVRRRSYGPAKEGLGVKRASSDSESAAGGIWGDWTWRVLAVLVNFFLLRKSCLLPTKLYFRFCTCQICHLIDVFLYLDEVNADKTQNMAPGLTTCIVVNSQM